MAAASSSRARAGPPCEKSQLSVKGGSCRLAGGGRPGTCGGIADFGCIWSWRVHCLHSILGMASAALCPLGAQGRGAAVDWALHLLSIGRWLWGRLDAPVAARWLPAPGAASPGAAFPGAASPGAASSLCPAAQDAAALGVAGPNPAGASSQGLPLPPPPHPQPWGRVLSVETVTVLQPWVWVELGTGGDRTTWMWPLLPSGESLLAAPPPKSSLTLW